METKQQIALQKACEIAGSQSALAEVLGVSAQVINNWFRRGVPVDQVIPIYHATGVTPNELRSDIYPDPWYRPSPESASKQAA